MQKKNYLDQQKEYFQSPEKQKFFWRIKNPYIRKLEEELLSIVSQSSAKKILEVGCGEGNNLFLVQKKSRAGLCGIDYTQEKIKFAKKNCPGIKFSVGNALKLPFDDNSFDLVFCRDVLHHVVNKKGVLLEMARVLMPGGKLVVIEHNEANPVIFFWRTVNPNERADPPSIYNTYYPMLKKIKELSKVRYMPRESLPISRILLNYRFGFLEKMGHLKFFQIILTGLEALGIFLPRKRWAYLVFETQKNI